MQCWNGEEGGRRPGSSRGGAEAAGRGAQACSDSGGPLIINRASDWRVERNPAPSSTGQEHAAQLSRNVDRSPPHAGLLLTSLSVQVSRSFVSDSLQPHGLQHARPPCPSLPEFTHIFMEPTKASGEETPPDTPASRACSSWPTSQPLVLPDPNDPPWPVRREGGQSRRPDPASVSTSVEQRSGSQRGETKPVRPGLSTFCLYESGNSFPGPAR